MEIEKQKIREYSVWLRRCDLDSSKSSARAEGGVPAFPHEPPAVSHTTSHVLEYAEKPEMVIKTEHHAEDAFAVRQPSAGPACLREHCVINSSWPLKEEDDLVMKMEDETDEMMVKQELDVGPTVLQPSPAPRAQVGPDPHPSTSSGDGAAPAPRRMLFFSPTGQIKVKDDYCEEGYGVPCNAGYML